MVRTRIGMVFQQFNLFPHQTALGSVTLALRKVVGMAAEAARERAQEGQPRRMFESPQHPRTQAFLSQIL